MQNFSTEEKDQQKEGSKRKQVKSLSPKRKASKRRRCAPPTTLYIDSDDSSQNSKKSTSSGRAKRSSRSKKVGRRCVSPTAKSPKLQAMQEAIATLKSIQDQMEQYQANLEKQHRDFQREIHAMELSHGMVETRNRELESQLEEVLEENDRLCYGRRRSTFMEDDSSRHGEMELIRFENQVLRGKLERCELAFLRSTKRHSR